VKRDQIGAIDFVERERLLGEVDAPDDEALVPQPRRRRSEAKRLATEIVGRDEQGPHEVILT
jgi:hypothetical protein